MSVVGITSDINTRQYTRPSQQGIDYISGCTLQAACSTTTSHRHNIQFVLTFASDKYSANSFSAQTHRFGQNVNYTIRCQHALYIALLILMAHIE